MDWLQVLTLAGSMLGFCYWMHFENKKMFSEFKSEAKDFHGRLCTLEERYYQLMIKRLEQKENQ